MAKKKRVNFGKVMKQIGTATKPVGNIATTGIKSGAGVLNNGIKTVGDTQKQLIGSATGLLNTFGLPLIIGGCVVAYFVLTKK